MYIDDYIIEQLEKHHEHIYKLINAINDDKYDSYCCRSTIADMILPNKHEIYFQIRNKDTGQLARKGGRWGKTGHVFRRRSDLTQYISANSYWLENNNVEVIILQSYETGTEPVSKYINRKKIIKTKKDIKYWESKIDEYQKKVAKEDSERRIQKLKEDIAFAEQKIAELYLKLYELQPIESSQPCENQSEHV